MIPKIFILQFLHGVPDIEIDAFASECAVTITDIGHCIKVNGIHMFNPITSTHRNIYLLQFIEFGSGIFPISMRILCVQIVERSIFAELLIENWFGIWVNGIWCCWYVIDVIIFNQFGWCIRIIWQIIQIFARIIDIRLNVGYVFWNATEQKWVRNREKPNGLMLRAFTCSWENQTTTNNKFHQQNKFNETFQTIQQFHRFSK